MGQVGAVFTRGVKEYLREGAVLFWSIGWPIIWLLLMSSIFLSGIPEEFVPLAKGSCAISMATFSLMTVGMVALSGTIVQDRERGLFKKLRSLPISPWKEFLGRFASLLAFSAIGILLVIAVGIAIGAEFSFTSIELFRSIGFFFLILLASVGIGLLIGTFIKSVQLATGLGTVFMLLAASISGIFAPFMTLPGPLQLFSKVFPISSANSSILLLLSEGSGLGENYNPLAFGQVFLTAILSMVLFIAGLIAYSKLCWKEK